MIDPFKVYEPRKNKIKPFYTCKIEWRQCIESWKHDFLQNKVDYDYDDLDDFFYSAFSLNDYASHQEVLKLIDSESYPAFDFHKNIGYALELHTKGKYKLAIPFINKAIQHKHKENRLHFYVFQLRKNNKLLFDLQKIKSNKRKIEFLNSKYFEVSGNILYSCDLMGTRTILKLISKKHDHPRIKKLTRTIDTIYNKTKNYKGNMTLYNKDLIVDLIEETFDIITTLNEKEIDLLSPIHWIIISKYIALSNNIKWYYKSREIHKEAFLRRVNEYKYKNNVYCLYAIRAQLENSKQPQYDIILRPENYKIALAYAKLYENKYNEFLDNILQFETRKDKTYKKAIQNKTVAIVGPVENNLNNGKEIDSFDIVIRLNLVDISKYSKTNFGRKCNVLAYSREGLVRNYKKVLENLDDKQFLFFNSYPDDQISENLKFKTNVRQTLDISMRRNNILYSGYFTFIQRVIMDTLRFQPKRIKIFNTNLWLEINKNDFYIYQQKYDSTILIQHDIFSNFHFMKRMYDNNYIEGDSILSGILKLTPMEYCIAMHQNHCQ